MRTLLLLASLVCLQALSGQNKVVFETRAAYLGSFKPGSPKQEVTFLFYNKGEQAVLISGIDACKRCKVIGSSRGPVEPGGRGFITITYQLPEKQGRFMDANEVFLDGNLNSGIELVISGEILPREKTLADQFPYRIGGLRFKASHLDLGRFLNTEKVTRDFQVMNASQAPLDLRIAGTIMHMDAFLVPSVVLPGETAKLTVVYNAKKRPGYGPVKDTLLLLPQQNEQDVVRVPLMMYLEEDFGRLRPSQLEEAPKVSFANTNHEFGAVKAGTQVNHTFYISNRGRRQLRIRKVVSSSPQLDFELASLRVRYRQDVELKVTYNAISKPGPFMEELTLICNDPSRPEVKVYIQGAVIP